MTANSPAVYAAGWVDDWLQQKTSSGPNYYSGQQRGYATAGGFNARWKTGVDYPISISPPSFKAGCGGIDFFGGSVSYLNMDMLVAKLQRILQNSAGIAFSMALETVCPKCANIMNVMEQMSNQINGMGMNDCSMAKGLTVGVVDASKTALKELQEGTLSESVGKGLNDGYEYAKRELTAADGSNVKKAMDWLNTKMASNPNKDPLMAGCPTEATDIFPGDLDNGKNYVLDVIGTKLGMPTAHINVMRGLVGDILITGADTGYNVTPVPPCAENEGLEIDAVKEGFIYSKAKDATGCTLIVDANANMVTYVTNTMNTIANKMKNKSTFTPGDPEEQFIMNSPLPVAYALKVGISTGQEGTIINNMASITASALSAKAMTELVNRVSTIMQVAQEQNAKVMNPKDNCFVSVHYEKLQKVQGEFMKRIDKVNQGLESNMRRQMQDYSNVINMVQYIENINRQLELNLVSRFGASVAQRAMR